MFFVLPIVFTVLSAFLNPNFSMAMIVLFFITKKVIFGSLFLTCGLPTIFGILAFNAINKNGGLQKLLFQFLLPLLCMALFIAHPAARPAFVYSFYWLIPAVLYFCGRNKLFFAALSATFVSHAVGSVLYLYATNMPAAKWLSLIPVVAYERLVAAFGITCLYMGIIFIINVAGSKRTMQ